MNENECPFDDNRPIRPMDQNALNEALNQLPILIDEFDPTSSTTKLRRQPHLAYSTRRKTPLTIKSNFNVQTPSNFKGKIFNEKTPIAVSTKKNKFQLEIEQLKDEKFLLEQTKIDLELEISLIKKTNDEQIELIKEENRRQIEQMKVEVEKFRKLVEQNETTIKNLRSEIDEMKKPMKNRNICKVSKTNANPIDRPRFVNSSNIQRKDPISTTIRKKVVVSTGKKPT